jgi:hypothetical protein
MDNPIRNFFLLVVREWLTAHGPAKGYNELDEQFLIGLYNYIMSAEDLRKHQ